MGLLRIDTVARGPWTLCADGHPLVPRCFVADRPLARLVGLLGTPDLRPGEALLITPCRAVHAVGLRAPAGVAFVGRDAVVLAVAHEIPRRGAMCRRAAAAVEMHRDVARLVAPGTRLTLRAADRG